MQCKYLALRLVSSGYETCGLSIASYSHPRERISAVMAISTRADGLYKLPEEVIRRGIIYQSEICASNIEKLETLDMTENDVIVVGYPKSGMFQVSRCQTWIYLQLLYSWDCCNPYSGSIEWLYYLYLCLYSTVMALQPTVCYSNFFEAVPEASYQLYHYKAWLCQQSWLNSFVVRLPSFE